MAKWDQRDPRWIVEVRPDGTNVNNWHWVEKNATSWSKNKITELLAGLVVQNEDYFCEITELSKIEGEATANNRKAKLIFFYEWDIKLEWSGKYKTSNNKFKGKAEVLNLSEENTEDELDINVSVEDSGDEAYKVKEFMRIEGVKKMQKQLGIYIRSLKEEYSQGIILPTKDKADNKDQKVPTVPNNVKREMNKTINGNETKKIGDSNFDCMTLKTHEEFVCSAADLYRVFTVPELMSAFSGGDVVCKVEDLGEFSLYSGFVTGRFIETVPNKKIVQKWRLKNWPTDHFSHVTLEFEEKGDSTMLHLTQTGIPQKEYEYTQDGWAQNYWARIRQRFGYGSHIF
ncbi:of 90 kDa heat shock ATPase homolog 1-like [Octopus vulgaris]|uniref:Of 90 kDa heat shock ATPase homolog 1-like n=2 Tax=Octopus TaxID=6643 RepID=A0AA36AGU3_OCTVU|nr:activator of 90 kDa heat shock protein ATPase homolog 1 [Octopus sinensis]CAI9715076.1 of 90 kDa heat shock ATPase homolog 1-like [Octopus vulgaris]